MLGFEIFSCCPAKTKVSLCKTIDCTSVNPHLRQTTCWGQYMLFALIFRKIKEHMMIGVVVCFRDMKIVTPYNCKTCIQVKIDGPFISSPSE